MNEWMNEWMFNDTPAQNINRLLGVNQMVTEKQICIYKKIKDSYGLRENNMVC